MGKIVKAVAVIGIAIAIAVAAPYLAPGLISLVGSVGITLSYAAASAIVTTGLSLAAGLVMAAVFPKPSSLGSGPSNFRQSLNNSQIVLGMARVSMVMTFFHPKKVGKDQYRYFVWTAAGHRCKGVVRYFLNDDAVTVDPATGAITSGPYAGAGSLWFERGAADAQAHPVFVAECDGKWTTAHRGAGIAKLYAKFKMTKEVVAAGMPSFTVELEGSDEIEDVRDGTVGYTNNAMLTFNWWMTLPRSEGGFGCRPDEMDDDWTAAQANVCDERVARADGTDEARYALDGFLTTGSDPSAVRQVLVDNMAGRFTYSGGKMLCRPGYWVPVSTELAEDDLVAGIRLSLLPGGDTRVTEVTATFNDPAALYQPAELPARSTGEDDPAQASLDLPFVKSATRAQRIQKIALLRGSVEKTLTWPMNIVGLGVSPMDTVRCATARHGLSNYAFTVRNWTIGQDFSILLDLAEENPEMYDWDIGEEVAVIDPPRIGRADPVDDAPPARAAYQIVNRSIPYPVTSDDDSIQIEAFSAVLDDGRTIAFPAASIAELTAGTTHAVLWSLAGRTYSAIPAPASAQLASPDFAFLGWSTTSDAGTYPDQPTAPGGWGGNGASNVQEV